MERETLVHDHEREMLADIENHERLSNCCFSWVYEFGDSSMCGDCKEWCDLATEE